MSIHSYNSKDGFSLVEMLVVISIFLIITGIIMANLPRFRNRASLDLVSQDIALTIRQAQVFGLGSRQFSDEFRAFGVHFDDPTNPDNRKSFILFGDKSNNFKYDGDDCKGESTECIEKYRVEGGLEIIDTCYSAGGGDTAIPDNNLDIVFKRPNPEPIIEGVPGSYERVKIILQATRSGETRSINVWSTGQMSVTEDDCQN